MTVERRRDYRALDVLSTDIKYIKESIDKGEKRDLASDKKFDDHVNEDKKYHQKVDKVYWVGCGLLLGVLYLKDGVDGIVKAAFAAIGG